MPNNYLLKRKDLIYPDLSFKVVGILIDVYKQLGPGHQEKYYQNAVSLGLARAGLKFTEQKHVPLKFHGANVGRYFLDFLVEDKLVLELKKGEFIPKETFDQVKGYLTALNLQLAIIANFTLHGVFYKRIIGTPVVIS